VSGDAICCEGVVVDCAHDFFHVEVDLGGSRRRVLCRLAGKLHTHRIRVTPGDVVTVEVSPYDLGRGRITYRGRREARP
jgi:translation initiation factor IF-1